MGGVMRAGTCALLVALGMAPGAQGQHVRYGQRREGFWIGFGLGYGTANVTCDGCASGPRVGAVTASLKLGGTPSPHLRIGGAITAWIRPDSGFTETMSNVTASLYFYPDARSGFFVSGGLGFSNYHLDSSPSFNGTGWGFTAGAGYDFRVARRVSLTPTVNFVYGGVGDVNQAGIGTVITGWKQNVVDFGLGVTFH